MNLGLLLHSFRSGCLVVTACALLCACKTVEPYSVPKAEKKSAAAERGKIYSCSDLIQAPKPTAEQPLAGRYVVTAFGDSGTLTWMAHDGANNDVFDAECRYDAMIDVTTCDTYADSVIKRNGDTGPIWAFTVDHAHEDDVRIFGFNGTVAQFKASGKPMPLLGTIPQCPDESKR